jgi:hypothetical protein
LEGELTVLINSARGLRKASTWFSSLDPTDYSKPTIPAVPAPGAGTHGTIPVAVSAVAHAEGVDTHDHGNLPKCRSLFTSYDPAFARVQHLQALNDQFTKFKEFLEAQLPARAITTTAGSMNAWPAHSPQAVHGPKYPSIESPGNLFDLGSPYSRPQNESPGIAEYDAKTYKSAMSKTAREAIEKVRCIYKDCFANQGGLM